MRFCVYANTKAGGSLVGHRVTDFKQSSALGCLNRPMHRSRGVALVITLILLAVIATLAIAFLALTYRETASVDAMGRTTDSELASDSALERAKAQIVAPFAFHNQGKDNFGSDVMGPDFTVSVAWDTNRIDLPSTPFNELTNMFRDPSPPVFVDTNRGTAGPAESRFFHDLNRNGLFEPTGFVPVTTDVPDPGSGYGFAFERDASGVIVTNWLVGDPEWLGVLQEPNVPHGPNNRFIARYAFLIQPIGRSLDVNWIHNDVKGISSGPPSPGPALGYSGYFRNQGVGCHELNLAAFLCDLNANVWDSQLAPYGAVPYTFATNSFTQSVGTAFDDAWQLLRYRCNGSRLNFNTLEELLSPTSLQVVRTTIANDEIDNYSDGVVPKGPTANGGDGDDSRKPWPGSDSKRHYYTPHDFFDRSKLGARPANGRDFVERLLNFSKLGNSYDRYTYYRMLAQMGTDSAEEDEGKININYVNVGGIKASELIPWSDINTVRDRTGRPGPELFLLSAATNIFARDTNFSFIVTNRFYPGTSDPVPPGTLLTIPVYTNGSTLTTNLPSPGPLYSGRIHQILQQVANIHDATTGPKIRESLPYYPSVFRPQFVQLANGNVYITNYTLFTGSGLTLMNSTNFPWRDLESGERLTGGGGANDSVYGVPLIIGARKGFPNFNELAVMTTADVTRKLTIFRSTAGAEAERTNQLLTVKVTAKVQMEARNSYPTPYPRQLDLYFGIRTATQVTNSFYTFPATNWVTGFSTSFMTGQWAGQPYDENQSKLNYKVSSVLDHTLIDWSTNTPPDAGGFTNYWGATLTNRMLFFLVDRATERIVDAVSLNGPREYFDVAKLLQEDHPRGSPIGEVWNGEPVSQSGGISLGVARQIEISTDASLTGDGVWGNYDKGTAPSKEAAIANFVDYLSNKRAGEVQVPFTPMRRMIQANYFRVADPLVHYNLEDYTNEDRRYEVIPLNSSATNLNLGTRNPRSIPWNGGTVGPSVSTPGQNELNPTLRDPGLTRSERWDFPTNLFPSLGWLGRVHRSTPWQSIYLKSLPPTQNWRNHSGPLRTDESANLMQPTADWKLLDSFTTALHPNATRGRLSVNQTNLAAWSAVLAGVVTSGPMEDPDLGLPHLVAQPVVIEPAALSNSVQFIVAGVNEQRTNFANGQFKRFGDFLSVSNLTFGSPFLATALFNPAEPHGESMMTDGDYERIPQQILSLLKFGEPRFVVYSWGQSLKPARRNPENSGPSIVTAGPDKGLCLNYQITGEMATRAVIRVEFEPIDDPASPLDGKPDYRRPHAVLESFNILPTE
jgi:hypothetical protein